MPTMNTFFIPGRHMWDVGGGGLGNPNPEFGPAHDKVCPNHPPILQPGKDLGNTPFKLAPHINLGLIHGLYSSGCQIKPI